MNANLNPRGNTAGSTWKKKKTKGAHDKKLT